MSVRVRILELGGPLPGLAAAVLAGLPAPFAGGEVLTSAQDLAPCRDDRRGQVDASCLLGLLPDPGAGWLVLGLAGVDLFLPVLTYVFGASTLGGRRSVLSTARLRLDDDPPGPVTSPLVRRTTVESMHELGHALGLVHCAVGECAMHRTLWPEAIDLKLAEYCPACRGVLERGA